SRIITPHLHGLAVQWPLDTNRSPAMIKTKTMANSKPRKKSMTLENFASAIQSDLLAIRKDMATKADLYDVSQKMVTRVEFRELQSDVKMVTGAMVSKADLAALREELLIEIRAGSHVEELRQRVAAVEHKLGIEPRHSAA